MLRGFFHLFRSQTLTMRAISTDFGTLNHDLKAEYCLDLMFQVLERLPEVFFNTPTAQTNDVGVLALHPGLVVVLVAHDVHEVKLIDQATLFQHLERPVDGHTVQPRVDLASHQVQSLSVKMFPRLIDEIQQYLALPRQPEAFFPERVPYSLWGHERR